MAVCDSEKKLELLLEKDEMIKFTPEELAAYDGTGGKPAYVAVNGMVYDVSDSISWENGMHADLQAGRDLTENFVICHLDQTVIGKYKVVGKLVV